MCNFQSLHFQTASLPCYQSVNKSQVMTVKNKTESKRGELDINKYLQERGLVNCHCGGLNPHFFPSACLHC